MTLALEQNTGSKTARMGGAVITAAIVTFTLFVLMQQLIQKDLIVERAPIETPVLDILSEPEKTKTNEIDRKPPPPPPQIKQPPRTAMTPDDSVVDFNVAPNFGMELSHQGNTIDIGGAGMRDDNEAAPIVRVAPRYPIVAARDGKEGWVQLQFTINEMGGVENVSVIDAQPKRLFNKEAIRALKKWKYAPKKVDGVPVRQENLQVQLDFSLENS